MFARRIQVQLAGPHGPGPCPIVWLDSFFMRSFTGRSGFDETIPIADGLIEVGFRVDLQALRADLEDWLTRKFGAGQTINLALIEINSAKYL